MKFFTDLEKTIQKLIWNKKKLRTAKTIEGNISKVGDITILALKL